MGLASALADHLVTASDYLGDVHSVFVQFEAADFDLREVEYFVYQTQEMLAGGMDVLSIFFVPYTDRPHHSFPNDL